MAMTSVTIDEVRAARREAEAEILSVLERLAERAQVDVVGLHVETLRVRQGSRQRTVIVSVGVELEIPS